MTNASTPSPATSPPPAAPMAPALHVRRADQMTSAEMYRCCRLRQDVFVVEQDCPYPDMDGRDLEPETMHLWFADGDDVLAYVRVLTDPDLPGGWRVGRVVTAMAARGQGLAGRLIERALELKGDHVVSLGAQERLEGWYGSFGFVRIGPNYLEDDMPHVPMRRLPAPRSMASPTTRT